MRLRGLVAISAIVVLTAFGLVSTAAARPQGRAPAGKGHAAKPAAQCRDGIDNDGDGLIDLGQDPGCTSPNDNSELDNLPQCSDGLDNDADGFIDYPADSGCDSPSDILESNLAATQCADGRDNDGDGLIDFPTDPGCFSVLDNSEKTH